MRWWEDLHHIPDLVCRNRTNSCSERETDFFLAMAAIPSMFPVALNAQQLPIAYTRIK